MPRFLQMMLIAFASILALAGTNADMAQAQKSGDKPPPPKAGDPQSVSISFRNDTMTPLLVQGCSKDKSGMLRRGQPLLIQPGKTVFDNSVPVGWRWITVADSNQSTRILLREFRITVAPGGDLPLIIRSVPGNNPPRVVLERDQ